MGLEESSMKKATIQMNLFDYFYEQDNFTIKEATELVKEVRGKRVNDESIRARIYEGIDRGIFKRVSRGVYKVESQINGTTNQCLLINGDGRDLSMIKDNSIDGIITDHPYKLPKQLKGGNRNFAEYELFKYEEKDFKEKSRVLKDGAFIVEFLPEESEINYEYLYEIKQMAKKSGLKYFAKVPWIKGNSVANTGRKSKNTEDVMIFSKGKPRSLKLNAKKNIQTALNNGLDIKGMDSSQVKALLEENNLVVHYMSGTSSMLPTQFNYQPKSITKRVHQAEKPVELLEEIISYISLPYEVILDQFAGSGNLAVAALNVSRNAIVIEGVENIQNTSQEKRNLAKENFNLMKKNIEEQLNKEATIIDINRITNSNESIVGYEKLENDYDLGL